MASRISGAVGASGQSVGMTGTAALFEFPQVSLADVPADHFGRVEHRHAQRRDLVQLAQESLVVVLIIPGAVDHDGGEGAPVDGRVGPAVGVELEAVRRKARLQDIQLKVETIGVRAAIRRG